VVKTRAPLETPDGRRDIAADSIARQEAPTMFILRVEIV
jgi:hypothetical protein